MNLEQWTALQPRILDAQRLALTFGELGQMKIARLLLQAATMASRIKPTKPADSQAPASESSEKKPAKGKGA